MKNQRNPRVSILTEVYLLYLQMKHIRYGTNTVLGFTAWIKAKHKLNTKKQSVQSNEKHIASLQVWVSFSFEIQFWNTFTC